MSEKVAKRIKKLIPENVKLDKVNAITNPMKRQRRAKLKIWKRLTSEARGKLTAAMKARKDA